MRYLALIFILSSCSASYHVKKAVKKDPTLLNPVSDTIRIEKTLIDTVYTSDSTFYIEVKTVQFDTIIQYQKMIVPVYKTRQEIRQKEKTERTEIKQGQRTERFQYKQERKIANNWYKTAFFILLGFVLILIARFVFLRGLR
tara:strand:- start:916 stop:1341 length:426 start_codon:yes stop_codon:yes gene_type:complete